MLKRVTLGEGLHFIFERYEDADSMRDYDYEVTIGGHHYRGILLNSGYALVSGLISVPDVRVAHWILEPGHARS
jgi:hypothetical protein